MNHGSCGIFIASKDDSKYFFSISCLLGKKIVNLQPVLK